MTFLLTVDDQVLDVDRAWNALVVGLAPETPVGRASITLAVAVGLRLALLYPGLARVMLIGLERDMAAACGEPAEEAEITLRELLDTLLERARVGAADE